MNQPKHSLLRLGSVAASAALLVAAFALVHGGGLSAAVARAASSEPVISSVVATSTDTTATITWVTDETSSSQVAYGTTTPYATFSTLDSTQVTSHSLTLSALDPGTTYHFEVISSDASSNMNTSVDQTFTTTNTASTTTTASTTEPVLSSVLATPTDTTALITWITDEPASSQVEYGTTSAYTASTTLDNGLVTDHSQALTGLTPNTLYHFAVMSADASSSMASSPDQTFMTASSTAVATTTGLLLATPPSGMVGDTITVSGSGFMASEPVVLQFGSALPTTTITADTNGMFSTTLAVPSLTSGVVTITAQGATSGQVDNASFTIEPTSTTTGTGTTTGTTGSTTLDLLISQLEGLQSGYPNYSGQLQGLINELAGSGTTIGNTGSGTIDQNGQTFNAGGTIDLSGRNFGHEENVTVSLNGQTVTTAHADGGGNFSTGSMTLPSTPGTYTYQFVGQSSGITASAAITVM